GGRVTSLRLLLAGVAVGYALYAVTSFLIFASDSAEGSRPGLFWLLGSLSLAAWGAPLTIVFAVAAPPLPPPTRARRRRDAPASRRPWGSTRTASGCACSCSSRCASASSSPPRGASASSASSSPTSRGGSSARPTATRSPSPRSWARSSSSGPTWSPGRSSHPRRSRWASSPPSSAHRSCSSSSAACTSRRPDSEPPPLPVPRRARTLVAVCAVALLAACGDSSGAGDAETRADEGHYPVTVENCGSKVTIESEPTDVVMLKSAMVPFLTSVGVLDHVTAKAGAYPEGYFDDDVRTRVEEIETL